MPNDRPPHSPRLGFTVTETVLPTTPVEPDPFIGGLAPADGSAGNVPGRPA